MTGAGSVLWVRLRGGADSFRLISAITACSPLSWDAVGWPRRAGQLPAPGRLRPAACGSLLVVVIAGYGAGLGPGLGCPDLGGDVGGVVADPVDERGAAGVLVVHPEEVQARRMGDP